MLGQLSSVWYTQWGNDRPCYAGGRHLRGGILPNLLFFKRKIVRRGRKMEHISANLAFGGREKNIWGYKKLQGGKKPVRKTEKKSGDLFLSFF